MTNTDETSKWYENIQRLVLEPGDKAPVCGGMGQALTSCDEEEKKAEKKEGARRAGSCINLTLLLSEQLFFALSFVRMFKVRHPPSPLLADTHCPRCHLRTLQFSVNRILERHLQQL